MLSAKAPSCMAAIEGFDSGSTDFVSKPFDAQVLSKKVAVALAMKEEAKGPDATGPNPSELTLLAQLSSARSDCKQATDRAEDAERRLKEVEQQLRTKSDALEVQKKRLEESERVQSENQRALEAAKDQVQQQAEQLLKHEEKQKAQAEALQEIKSNAGKQQQAQQHAQQQAPQTKFPSPRARAGEGLRHRRHTPQGSRMDRAFDSRRAEQMELMETTRCFEELAVRDAEIVELRGELARHVAANRLVANQLAMHSRMSTQLRQLLTGTNPVEDEAKTGHL